MQGDKGETGEVGFPGRRVSNFVDIFFRNSTLSCLYLNTKMYSKRDLISQQVGIGLINSYLIGSSAVC